ncbi:MAG: adenine-specific DNA-methyltransferase, partial [Thermodesulfobacteriota bacterium]|nr:adenine-specific DNA-methyltransferase [Thermodesulfobacteriota bacterium]
VIFSKGNIVRISKNKNSKTLHEIVSRNWEDWIDYWAVDFEYGNTAENTDAVSNDQAMQDSSRQPVFREHWQSFRTRKGGPLEITSATHSYAKEGQYTIAVRMTDILGNEAFDRVVVRV